MKVSGDQDDIILQYIDGTLGDEEKKAFEYRLASDVKLKERFRELQAMDQMLMEKGIDFPSSNFTQKVMANLHQYPIQVGSVMNKTLLLLAGIIVLVGVGVAFVTTGLFDSTQTVIDVNAIEPINQYVDKPLPSIPFDGKQFLNAVIFINLIIALIVLDRTILKPLFQKRTQSHF